MVNTKDDIVDKLRAPYGRLTRAMREDAACEIERSRALIAELEAFRRDAFKEVAHWSRKCGALEARAAYLGKQDD